MSAGGFCASLKLTTAAREGGSRQLRLREAVDAYSESGVVRFFSPEATRVIGAHKKVGNWTRVVRFTKANCPGGEDGKGLRDRTGQNPKEQS